MTVIGIPKRSVFKQFWYGEFTGVICFWWRPVYVHQFSSFLCYSVGFLDCSWMLKKFDNNSYHHDCHYIYEKKCFQTIFVWRIYWCNLFLMRTNVCSSNYQVTFIFMKNEGNSLINTENIVFDEHTLVFIKNRLHHWRIHTPIVWKHSFSLL